MHNLGKKGNYLAIESTFLSYLIFLQYVKESCSAYICIYMTPKIKDFLERLFFTA